MIAALHDVRAKQPMQLVCIAPVASPSSLKKIKSMSDLVVCLQAPENFMSPGQFIAALIRSRTKQSVAFLRMAQAILNQPNSNGQHVLQECLAQFRWHRCIVFLYLDILQSAVDQRGVATPFPPMFAIFSSHFYWNFSGVLLPPNDARSYRRNTHKVQKLKMCQRFCQKTDCNNQKYGCKTVLHMKRG